MSEPLVEPRVEPLVSVILIGYNDAGRITRALDSIRDQTLHSIEIIVVDDASTDATSQIVTAVAEHDSRIHYLQRAENSGGCSAPRNDGLAPRASAVGDVLRFGH
jgi:Glycosyltransferases involved in cell wall biogenesis